MQRIGVKGVKGIMCAIRAMAHIRILRGFSTFWRMGRNGVKGIMLLLLLLCPILVGAQPGYSCFYTTIHGCIGHAWCCTVLFPANCCKCVPSPGVYGWSAYILAGGHGGHVTIYNDNDCHNQYQNSWGSICSEGTCYTKFFSSQWWETVGHPPQTVGHESCNGSVYTDAMMYTFITDEGRRANWVLRNVNVSEVDFDPSKLSPYQQVEWYKSHGATLEAEDGEFIFPNVTGLPDPDIEPPPIPC